MHYSSFGRTDTIAHSTIIDGIDGAFERHHLWMNLASFAISHEEVARGKELLSGGAEFPMEDDAEAEAEAAALAEAEAARVLAVQAKEANYQELAARRDAGKRAQAEAAIEKAARRQRKAPENEHEHSDR